MKQNNRIMNIIRDAEIQDKYDLLNKKEPKTIECLEGILKHYQANKLSYSDKCEGTAQRLLMQILKDDDLKGIHSARYRVKSIDSLLVKYINKKAILSDNPCNDYNMEKYRPMNNKNYYKIITDLIGIRILIRYQQQWQVVHKWIWDTFYKSSELYINNWIDDYPSDSNEDFIVEKPKLYLRNETELPLYQVFGKDVFEHKISKEGYSSIHYLLWYDGKYVEIQVRTIYDEAWGECTHDLVYKCKEPTKRNEMERLSECLAIQTQAAAMVSSLMYEKSCTSVRVNADDESVLFSDKNKQSEAYQKVEKRIHKMACKKADDKEFDGSIDGLIDCGGY